MNKRIQKIQGEFCYWSVNIVKSFCRMLTMFGYTFDWILRFSICCVKSMISDFLSEVSLKQTCTFSNSPRYTNPSGGFLYFVNTTISVIYSFTLSVFPNLYTSCFFLHAFWLVSVVFLIDMNPSFARLSLEFIILIFSTTKLSNPSVLPVKMQL